MNTYGELSNASLLHTYGFTEEDNPHDEVSFLLCSAFLPTTMNNFYNNLIHFVSQLHLLTNHIRL